MKANGENDSSESNRSIPEATQNAKQSLSAPRKWASQELLGEAQTAVIEHAGQQYCLRRTKENKLILTK